MLPQLYRVQHVRDEMPDTFTLELEPQDGSAIPPFATGQFNMLYVFGVGEIPISISGDPAKRKPLVHTTRAVGTVSRAMRELKPENVVGVRGPFGSHWPIEHAMGKDIVIVTGGIGLAPLRSARRLLAGQHPLQRQRTSCTEKNWKTGARTSTLKSTSPWIALRANGAAVLASSRGSFPKRPLIHRTPWPWSADQKS